MGDWYCNSLQIGIKDSEQKVNEVKDFLKNQSGNESFPDLRKVHPMPNWVETSTDFESWEWAYENWDCRTFCDFQYVSFTEFGFSTCNGSGIKLVLLLSEKFPEVSFKYFFEGEKYVGPFIEDVIKDGKIIEHREFLEE